MIIIRNDKSVGKTYIDSWKKNVAFTQLILSLFDVYSL